MRLGGAHGQAHSCPAQHMAPGCPPAAPRPHRLPGRRWTPSHHLAHSGTQGRCASGSPHLCCASPGAIQGSSGSFFNYPPKGQEISHEQGALGWGALRARQRRWPGAGGPGPPVPQRRLQGPHRMNPLAPRTEARGEGELKQTGRRVLPSSHPRALGYNGVSVHILPDLTRQEDETSQRKCPFRSILGKNKHQPVSPREAAVDVSARAARAASVVRRGRPVPPGRQTPHTETLGPPPPRPDAGRHSAPLVLALGAPSPGSGGQARRGPRLGGIRRPLVRPFPPGRSKAIE